MIRLRYQQAAPAATKIARSARGIWIFARALNYFVRARESLSPNRRERKGKERNGMEWNGIVAKHQKIRKSNRADGDDFNTLPASPSPFILVAAAADLEPQT